MKALKFVVVVFAIIVILLLLSSMAMRWYAVGWLKEQGYNASIGHLGVNYITGKVTLSDVNIEHPDKPSFSASSLVVSVNLLALPGKKLAIRNFTGQGINSSLIQQTQSQGREGATTWLSDLSEWQITIAKGSAADTDLCRRLVSSSQPVLEQCLNLGQFYIADATLKQVSGHWQLTFDAPASFQRLYVKDHTQNLSIVYLGEALFSQADLQAGRWQFSEPNLSNFHLVERDLTTTTGKVKLPYQTQFGKLTADKFDLEFESQRRLTMTQLEVTSLRQTFHRNAQGEFELVSKLNELLPHSFDTLIDKDDTSKPFQVVIDRAELISSSVAFLDDSVTPSASQVMSGLKAVFESIDTANELTKTELNASANLGTQGKIMVQGPAYLASKRPNFELKGFVKGLELSDVSAYTKVLLGSPASSGIFDSQFRAKSVEGLLSIDSVARLTRLQSAPGVTIQRTFDRLKNVNEQVDFNLDFSHDFSNKRQSLMERMGQQVKRSLTRSVSNSDKASEITQRLENAGLKKKVSQVSDQGESREKVIIKPFKFSTDSISLKQTEEKRFRELVMLMRDQPTWVLDICPVASGGEWARLYNNGLMPESDRVISDSQREHLSRLLDERVSWVVDSLEKFGIDENRVNRCEDKGIRSSYSGFSYMSASL